MGTWVIEFHHNNIDTHDTTKTEKDGKLQKQYAFWCHLTVLQSKFHLMFGIFEFIQILSHDQNLVLG